MYRFAGFLGDAQFVDAARVQLKTMTGLIARRGPVDSEYWLDRDTGVVLDRPYLAIVDWPPAGYQLMLSGNGRYVVAFNGKIYNHLELRAKLEDMDCRVWLTNADTWRGHSDAGMLLAGFDAWGIEATVKKRIGMFAFAVWDT